MITRRSALGLLAMPMRCMFGQIQGMASRGIKAAPRGKASGIPFRARFTDIAASAGLKVPIIAGHPQRANYVIEAMSCGVAFFDYDHDGWLDILLLTGSRFGDPPANAVVEQCCAEELRRDDGGFTVEEGAEIGHNWARPLTSLPATLSPKGRGLVVGAASPPSPLAPPGRGTG